jgi:hypothetical protein
MSTKVAKRKVYHTTTLSINNRITTEILIKPISTIPTFTIKYHVMMLTETSTIHMYVYNLS